VKTRPELVDRAVHHITAGRTGSVGTIRVDAIQVEQLRYEVTPRVSLGHRLVVDEPPQRGGTDQGPTPLEYFLTGALTCLLTQIIKLAMARRLALDTIKGSVRAHVHYAVDGGLSDFVYDINMTGSEAADAVKTLALDAERYCYVHVTLKRAVPLTLRVFLNGVQVLDHTTGPGMTPP
jgi:uncharacterized OsmC-like protein